MNLIMNKTNPYYVMERDNINMKRKAYSLQFLGQMLFENVYFRRICLCSF